MRILFVMIVLCAIGNTAISQTQFNGEKLLLDFSTDTVGCLGLRKNHIELSTFLIDGEFFLGKDRSTLIPYLGKPNTYKVWYKNNLPNEEFRYNIFCNSERKLLISVYDGIINSIGIGIPID